MTPQPDSTNSIVTADVANAMEQTAAVPRRERLLINWVYYQAFGHATEAYKMAAPVADAIASWVAERLGWPRSFDRGGPT